MESRDDEFRHGQGITTTEMAVGKYRKRLLQSCGIGIVLGMLFLGVIERTYTQILQGLWTISVANWWLIPSFVVILGVVIIINWPRKRKRKGGVSKRENQQAQ